MDYSTILTNSNIQTPCFVIKEKEVDELSEQIETALKKNWKNGIIGYSFKTNNLPWIISFFKKKGFYAEVVSSDELELAIELGYTYDKIIFNGPVKQRSSFEKAIRGGSIVNVDSKRELRWLGEQETSTKEKATIGLRVNFCLEDFCPGETQCGSEDGRFGFSYECGELEKAIAFLRQNGIKLKGLHLHCSSKTRSLHIYEAIAKVASEIIDQYHLELEYVDIGGGYFGGMPGKPSFEEYFSAVHNILGKYTDLNVIIEPGMSIIGAGIDYVTTVIDTKKTANNQFAILNGSRTHIDPFKRKKAYSFDVVKCNECDASLKAENETILCGFTCMEDDRFFSIKNQQLSIGDKVVFMKVGAYTMGLSPQFIEFHPPIYRFTDGELDIVRKKVTAKGFVALNKGG